MSIGALFWESCIRYVSFFAWRDFIEILFFSSIFFVISRWLMRDEQRPVTRYWYIFMGSLMLAWWLQLPTIVLVLTANIPVLLMFFLLIHQETLQKNLVVPFHIVPTEPDTTDWTEELMPACLHVLNKKKSAIIVIEHSQSLEQYLQCPFRINSKMCKEHLVALFESSQCDLNKAIWLTNTGTLNGINVACNRGSHISSSPATWYEPFLPLTAHSDALVFYINSTTESFDLLLKDNIAEKLSANSILLILKKQVETESFLAGDHGYASTHEKKANQTHSNL